MGYSYAGTCFVTVDDARAAHCEGGYPKDAVDASGNVVSYACTGTTATGLSILYTPAGAASGTPLELATSYVACDELAIGSAVMTPDLAVAAWSWGFCGVLICYVTAFAAGRVLDAIGR